MHNFAFTLLLEWLVICFCDPVRKFIKADYKLHSIRATAFAVSNFNNLLQSTIIFY